MQTQPFSAPCMGPGEEAGWSLEVLEKSEVGTNIQVMIHSVHIDAIIWARPTGKGDNNERTGISYFEVAGLPNCVSVSWKVFHIKYYALGYKCAKTISIHLISLPWKLGTKQLLRPTNIGKLLEQHHDSNKNSGSYGRRTEAPKPKCDHKKQIPSHTTVDRCFSP